MDLDRALAEFDAAETTLRRLENVWERMRALVPQGISFVGDGVEGIEYENLRRAFGELVRALPAITGWTINEFPLSLDEIAHGRLDASDVGEPEMLIAVERAITAPGQAIGEYRFRFDGVRRRLVRDRVEELLGSINASLSTLPSRVNADNEPVSDSEWPQLVEWIREVERLMGSSIARKGRWRDLARHLAFGHGVDLHDIAKHDWPSVVPDIRAGLYTELDPEPVAVDDLGELVATRPRGRASTKLKWSALNDEAFERLVFNVIIETPGYENPLWPTRTRAPDRGRDLSVDRVIADPLSGVRRERVIIQCKHWLTNSVGPRDVAEAVSALELWEPPPVDVLIIATSGRFTSDAVTWIERHNHARKRPVIEPWPESHLESLLAQRPHLVAQSGLRDGS